MRIIVVLFKFIGGAERGQILFWPYQRTIFIDRKMRKKVTIVFSQIASPVRQNFRKHIGKQV